MSEQKPPQPPSPGAAGGSEGELNLEKQLDEVLARAASLAEQLSREFGPPEAQPVHPSVSADPTNTEATERQVDEGLTELDELVGKTRREVSEVKPEPDRVAPPSEDGGRRYALPDFMAEFTAPEPPKPAPSVRRVPPPPRPAGPPPGHPPSAPPGPPSARIGATGPTKLGAAGTGKLGVVGTPRGLSTGPGGPPGSAPGAAAGSAGGPMPAITHPEATPPASQSVVATTLSTVANSLVAALEFADRPFRSVSPGGRSMIGWIAVGTIVLALALLALNW